MDILKIEGMRYRGKHGYLAHERRDGNLFEVDLHFHADLRKAGKTDELSHTIDYRKAETIVSNVMDGPSRKLIEKLVYEIGTALHEAFDEVERITVKVRKMNPPLPTETNHSEVSMTWNR